MDKCHLLITDLSSGLHCSGFLQPALEIITIKPGFHIIVKDRKWLQGIEKKIDFGATKVFQSNKSFLNAGWKTVVRSKNVDFPIIEIFFITCDHLQS